MQENSKFIINFTVGSTPLHRLTGTTKVRLFLSLVFLSIVLWDIRLLLPLLVLYICGVVSTRPNWGPVRFIILFVVLMNIFNLFLYWLASPAAGLEWTGTNTPFYSFNQRFYFSYETLWYLGVRGIKMVTSFMLCLAFILSVTPSEFAAGLYYVHLPYKFCIMVELAFRYIPDVLRDYRTISVAAQARGMETDKRKASLMARLKQTLLIVIPLILTSFGKINDIANAMDLRGFGRLKKRSWYGEREPQRADRIVRALCIPILLFSLYLFLMRLLNPDNPQLWYPFNDYTTYNWRIL